MSAPRELYLPPLYTANLANEGLRSDAIIGMAPTVDHATVSARFENGSFADLGRAEANNDPPYKSMKEQSDDLPRQLWRAALQKIGRPAPYDAFVLSQMLEAIATITESFIHHFQSATISYPTLTALYQEDIANAVIYRGIKFLPSMGRRHNQPWKLVAAYAGHSLGFCKSYDDTARCHREEGDLRKAKGNIGRIYTKRTLVTDHFFK
ncbi:hypothetical protein EK21DRAFT_106560 [Setomelanomma holmii]|uniref:Uncharacterized protein n=1 Tax=Setomelanomma holmii TaxID=210430 RepID=A0A9P4HLF4_9PLEO|nr:hypothetical protein EK21DRAFT_106560 [Setomelanomma holmii]